MALPDILRSKQKTLIQKSDRFGGFFTPKETYGSRNKSSSNKNEYRKPYGADIKNDIKRMGGTGHPYLCPDAGRTTGAQVLGNFQTILRKE